MTHAELLAAGFDLDAAAHARLAAFVRALLTENTRLNLTAARAAATVWRVHVCDALALLPIIHRHTARTLLDVGTGGGLPGLPLACVLPDLQVTLLDATRKKVAALERIAAQLSLANVTTICGRAETVAHDPAQRERYDLVTARAVAALPVVVEYAAAFVRPGGTCWFFKSDAAECAAAANAAATCGLCDPTIHTYRLPGDASERVLIGYRKTTGTPANLPRSPGRARQHPL